MKQTAAVLFLAIGLCGIICGEGDTGGRSAPKHPSASSEDNRSTLVERQRNGVSLGAFKETLAGSEELLKKDCRNIILILTALADLDHDKIILLLVSILFCSAVMVFGLKKLKSPGKESEQPEQQ